MLRVLLISPHPLVTHLGAPKVLLELAAAIREEGGVCDVVGPAELGCAGPLRGPNPDEFVRRSVARLESVGDAYDVVEVDHEWLPVARRTWSPRLTLVARSVLLVHHFVALELPRSRGFRAWAGRVLHGRRRTREWAKRVAWADQTIAASDLVNVANRKDREELMRRGVAGNKIVLVPYGLDDARRSALSAARDSALADVPTLAFVGTYDYRKGASDLPRLLREVTRAVPRVRLRLLGTAGMIADEAGVRSFFDRRQQVQIDVVPRYRPDGLPSLLAGCWAGVFPSYVEGFGLGVLEMLAAGLPVAAYDAPGPPEMLPTEWLVNAGDTRSLAGCLISWLLSPEALTRARSLAASAAERFTWRMAARETVRLYGEAAATRGGGVP